MRADNPVTRPEDISMEWKGSPEMNISPTAAAACLLALAACGAPTPAQAQVVQQCAIVYDNGTPYDASDDYAEPVDDDHCEDGDHGYVWYYGGHINHGRWYGGSRTRPPQVVIVVRDVSRGGSQRTITRNGGHSGPARTSSGAGWTVRSGDEVRRNWSNTRSSSTGGSGSRVSRSGRR